MPRVVIPWAGTCRHRQSALQHIAPRYPWPVTIAEAPPGPWVKALAVMPAVTACDAGEIVVVADADAWTDGTATAVQAIEHGAGWAIPHDNVHRLTQTGTAAVIDGAAWQEQPLEQPPYHGIPGGGIIVARRETLLDAPLDPRFVGWGQEDECWAMALTALHGNPWRGTAPLVHYWHPPQPRLTRRRGSVEGWQLRRRYLYARHHTDAMRALLQEAKDALEPHQPALHDRSPQPVR